MSEMQANKKFNTALNRTAVKYGYDLIAEIGIINMYKGKKVPDITGEVISEIPKTK